MIYLDNNATTRLAPEVGAVIADAWRSGLVNPASQHRGGQQARRALEDARLAILTFLGARTVGWRPDRLVFTSGGTEANNWALAGLTRPGQQVLVSAIEHPSILATAQHLAALNIDVRLIPVDVAGVVRLDELSDLLRRQPTSLVAVMAANNETGVIQPIAEIARLAHEAGALVHCDAVQWVGKLPTTFADWGVDSLSVSCHKFHGPVGVGALCLRDGVTPRPLLFGGFQEDGWRPGTVPLPLVLGFAAACRLFSADVSPQLTMRRDRLETQLRDYLRIEVNGSTAKRLPHTSNVAFLGCDRQALLLAADRYDLCLSTGSACSSGSSERSPVLLAMGLPTEIVDSSVRFSVGRDTSLEEIDCAVEILRLICST
ncbi:MAG: cysteine desulfurase [Planctomycetaceae bacterium]|nr:cysteine desulfurase [Planctomycetaceae bacterium]